MNVALTIRSRSLRGSDCPEGAAQKDVIRRLIDTASRQGDELVYELRGPTDEAMKVLEQDTGA